MAAAFFEECFEMELIPNIPQNTVVVKDNASSHSRQINKIPNTITEKTRDNRLSGINCSSNTRGNGKSRLGIVYQIILIMS